LATGIVYFSPASAPQPFGEIGRHLRIGRLQIDHLIVFDHAKPFALSRLKPDNLHGNASPKTKHAPECGARS
jgi:hypothetical protein